MIKEYQGKYIGIYPGGYIYYGDMKEGKREGKGKWIFFGRYSSAGSSDVKDVSYCYTFEGIWKDDYPNGKGTIIQREFHILKNTVPYVERKGAFIDGCLDGEVVEIEILNDGRKRTFRYSANLGKSVGTPYQDFPGELLVAHAEEDPNHVYLYE